MATPVKPLPTNIIPKEIIPLLSAVAGVVTFGILPAIHTMLPFVPTLDVTAVQSILGMMVALGIWISKVGIKTATTDLSQNILPELVAQVLPLVEDILTKEVAKQYSSIVKLDEEDLKAVSLARTEVMSKGQKL